MPIVGSVQRYSLLNRQLIRHAPVLRSSRTAPVCDRARRQQVRVLPVSPRNGFPVFLNHPDRVQERESLILAAKYPAHQFT